MKKWVKISLMVLASFAVIFGSANLYFHYWLQNHLPQYLKEKTPYQIHYQSLNIGLLKGDITATRIKIDTKKTNSDSQILLKGSIDSLYISNLGIYDALINKKINSKFLKLSKPNLHITLAKPIENQKKKNQPLLFKNLKIDDGNIELVRYNKTPFISVKNLILNIENLKLTEKEVERKLPVVFDNYSIKSNEFTFFPDEVYQISASKINTENGQMSIQNFALKPLMSYEAFSKKFPQKNLFDFSAREMDFKDIVLRKNKINLSQVQFLQPNLTLFTSKQKNTKKAKPFTYIVDLQNIIFRNGNVNIIRNNEKLFAMNQMNANFKAFLIDENSAKGSLPFQYKNYQISGRNVFYNAGKFYNIVVNSFATNKTSADFRNFSLRPKVSRAQFVAQIPTEKDLFDVQIAQAKLTGLNWKLENSQPNISLSNLLINNLKANIYRSKTPKDDLSRKKMYGELLRSVKFPLLVKNLDVKNSHLVYEEDLPNGNKAGKLSFANFNLNAKNLNSHKGNASTAVPIQISTQFMDVAPMNVNWNFDTANLNDDFTISGTIKNLPAERINAFITPYANSKIDGNISLMKFNFKGNNKGISGNYTMQHEDVKVAILDKETKKEKKLLSAVANLVVRTNSKSHTENVVVNTPRNPTKSFFNLLWKGVEEGLKKTLIGKNVEKTEKTVKDISETLKSKNSRSLQKEEKKTPFLKNIFKKKEKAEN